MRKILTKIVFSLLLLFAVSFVMLNKVAASSDTTIEYNFKELAALNDFEAIYATQSNGGYSQNVNFNDYWKLDSNGLTSTNQNISSGSTNNISYLSLTKYVFTNFEAEIVGKFENTSSWGWMGLVYRQETAGRAFFDEGGFAGVQKEGTALIWGSNVQGSGPFEGSKPNFDSQIDKRIKIRVVNKEVSVTVYDMEGNTLSSVSNTKEDRVLTEGYVSIVSIDNHHNFSSFKITNLDSNGEATNLVPVIKMEQIEVLNKPTTMDINETVSLNYNISTEDKNYNQIKVSSSNSGVVIASGNSLTAIGTGTAEIHVYSALDSNNCDTFTVTVTSNVANDGKITYVMDSVSALDNIKHNYVPDSTGNNAGDYEEYNTYWEYSEEYAGVVRINDKSNEPADDIVSILIKDQKFTNYEMTLVYQNTNDNSGWIGFVGLHEVASKRFMDHGFGAFIQSEGYPTIWGQGTGIHEQKDIVYDKSAIHILRLKVYNGIIEMYLDDMNNPALSYEIGSDKTNAGGEIGVFVSGAGYVIKSISYAYLKEDGSLNAYYPVDEFNVLGVPATAIVGESYKIETVINSNATIQNIVLESSDSNICIARNGKLSFISSGVVTIKVYPEDAPELAKEYVITVEEPDFGDDTDNQGGTNNENTKPNPENSGCSGSVVPTFIFVFILFGAILLIYKKKIIRG